MLLFGCLDGQPGKQPRVLQKAWLLKSSFSVRGEVCPPTAKAASGPVKRAQGTLDTAADASASFPARVQTLGHTSRSSVLYPIRT